MQDYLLSERDRIDGSHSAVDDVLAQALRSHESIRMQGEVLYASRGRVQEALDRFPAIAKLVSQIRRKHSKDSLVLAGVIALCSFVLIWYVFL